MKRNVDLTENGDFRENPKFYYSPLKKPRFDYSLKKALTELVLTGDSEERLYKQMETSFGSRDNHCDCCGTENPIYFIDKSSLCLRCETQEREVWWKD